MMESCINLDINNLHICPFNYFLVLFFDICIIHYMSYTVGAWFGCFSFFQNKLLVLSTGFILHFLNDFALAF